MIVDVVPLLLVMMGCMQFILRKAFCLGVQVINRNVF